MSPWVDKLTHINSIIQTLYLPHNLSLLYIKVTSSSKIFSKLATWALYEVLDVYEQTATTKQIENGLGSFAVISGAKIGWQGLFTDSPSD
jgi:hypothetical protein